jgi:hypothetical protein
MKEEERFVLDGIFRDEKDIGEIINESQKHIEEQFKKGNTSLGGIF